MKWYWITLIILGAAALTLAVIAITKKKTDKDKLKAPLIVAKLPLTTVLSTPIVAGEVVNLVPEDNSTISRKTTILRK